MATAGGWRMSAFDRRDPEMAAALRLVSAVVVLALLVGSAIGLWKAFSIPAEREETMSLVNYRHLGKFDYDVYVSSGTIYGLPPPESGETSQTYYRNIIDSIDLFFTYAFVPDGTVTEVTEDVEISALLGSPSTWQKEVPLLSKTAMKGDFTLNFALDLDALRGIADTVRNEIGTGTSENVTIVARVHVVAQTASGTIEDDFVQRTKLRAGSITVEWEPGLSLSSAGSSGGIAYEQRGEFDYAVHLKDNSLYGAITMKPPRPQSPTLPVALPTGQKYYTHIIDRVEGSFSYSFVSKPDVNYASAAVEVEALLEAPQFWEKSFVLVPETVYRGDFTITFPVDIDQYLDLLTTIRSELGAGPQSYNLIITADVHMVGETDYGTIDEVFSQSIGATLMAGQLAWGSKLDKSQEGSIRDKVILPNSVWPARVGGIVGLAVALLLSSYIMWRYTLAKPVPLTAAEAEARQAKRRRKDVIVDVEQLPQPVAAEMVVSVGSLDELIKAGDSLLKPVLHIVEPDKHTYRVIDGVIMYEYVSAEPPPPDEGEALGEGESPDKGESLG